MSSYPLLGTYPVIPAADLLLLQSQANRGGAGDARVGSSPASINKRGGQIVVRDAGAGDVRLVMALDDASSAGWRVVDGSTTYTPTNIGAFTDGADVDYADGLLTTDGGNDAAGRTTQSLTLGAGTYRVTGTAAFEGVGPDESSPNYAAPRIRIGSDATNGSYASKVVGLNAGHPTAAEDTDPTDTFDFNIVVAVGGTVHITLDVVDEAGALVAGSAFITLNALESV